MTNTGWPVMPAQLVLEQHAALHDQHAKPSPMLVRYYRRFLTDTDNKAAEFGNLRAQLVRWPLAGPEEAALLCGILAKGLFSARTTRSPPVW